jgi:hypothetical protein
MTSELLLLPKLRTTWQKRAANTLANQTSSYARLRQYFHVIGKLAAY